MRILVRHGLSHTRLYAIRKYMLRRCYNHNYKTYRDYGGRGIRVCDEWLDKQTGAVAFYEWAMNNGYRDDLSIDRIDVNGDYCPRNCRWVNNTVQARNKRPYNNMLGYPGIHRERSGRYSARITINGEAISLGTYNTPEEAAEAYRSAKKERDQGLG